MKYEGVKNCQKLDLVLSFMAQVYESCCDRTTILANEHASPQPLAGIHVKHVIQQCGGHCAVTSTLVITILTYNWLNLITMPLGVQQEQLPVLTYPWKWVTLKESSEVTKMPWKWPNNSHDTLMLVIWKGAHCEIPGTLMRRPSTNTAKICCQENRFMSSPPVIFLLMEIPSQICIFCQKLFSILKSIQDIALNCSATSICMQVPWKPFHQPTYLWCPWAHGTTVLPSVKQRKRQVTARINITSITEWVTKKQQGQVNSEKSRGGRSYRVRVDLETPEDVGLPGTRHE